MPSPSRIFKLSVPVFALLFVGLSLHTVQHETIGTVRQKFAEIKLWDSLPQRNYFCDGYARDPSEQAVEEVVRVEKVVEVLKAKDCSMCSVSPELCERLGERRLAKSQAYIGSGDRMRRFLAKAKSGDGFTVGVIGGSVSHGHGISHRDKLLHLLLFEHLDKLFPARGGTSIGSYVPGKNSFVNGAVPASGSDYFSYCFPIHIPEQTDLVLLELSVNDELHLPRLESHEMLLRGLLDMPDQPAVLALQAFALQFDHIALGGDLHLSAGQFYDIPTISLRNAILEDIFANGSLVSRYFTPTAQGPDLRHISPTSHRLLGELGTAYIDSQICEMDRMGLSDVAAEDVRISPIPKMRFMGKYNSETVTPKIAPYCRSANVKGEYKLVPVQAEGWRDFEKNDKHYLMADQPGSTASFEFTTSLGSVDLSYLRASHYGLGNAQCWVDDDRAKAVTLKGYWTLDLAVAQRANIRKDLQPGTHTMHCELLDQTDDPKGAKEFRLISLMSM